MSDVVHIHQQDLELKKKIGEGGFSTVYHMVWRSSRGEIHVAAKRLNKIERRELDILATLKHKHIVQLLGVVDESVVFMLILELCEDGCLRSYLDRQNNNRLPLMQLFDWAEQTAKPLQYLRQKGIVHKDIKAANYLIAKQKVLKLADFGLAKNVDNTQSNATGRGTWGWMAPELLMDEQLSPAFDIYSYAITLWELTTTEIPFKGLEYHVIVFQVCQNKMRPQIPDDCPTELAKLMKQCWHADRQERPTIDYVLSILQKAKEEFIKRSLENVGLPKSEKENESQQPHAPALCHQTSRDNKPPARPLRRQPSSGVWVYETKFGQTSKGKLTDACGIAVNSKNGDIVVADQDAARVNVFDGEGKFKFFLNTKQGLKPGEKTRPHGVAVSPDGSSYFITDGTQKVKEFDDSGIFKQHFLTVSPGKTTSDADDAKLAGVVIDVTGVLLVGAANKKYISKHTTDYSHRHEGSIQLPIEPCSLAVTPGNDIIVSSFKSHKVQVVSQAGMPLLSLDPPQTITQWSPYGVCCNDYLILVCNWATDKSKGIHCFSLPGFCYLTRIIPGDSACPKGLAILDHGRKLLVTETGLGCNKGVKIYHRI